VIWRGGDPAFDPAKLAGSAADCGSSPRRLRPWGWSRVLEDAEFRVRDTAGEGRQRAG